MRAIFGLLILCACDGGSVGDCTNMDAQTVPSTRAALADYLRCNSYASLSSESAPHPTVSAHRDNAKVFVNQALEDSLTAGNASHPVGAAAVKELFAADESTLIGWSVSVKVTDTSSAGDNWYWIENFDTESFDSPIGDGTGVSVCVGCHNAGTDQFLTVFPLQ